MLTETQIEEIRDHLEKAQNPIFYYDNDCDGLCSFVLFRKHLKRGKGVAVRSFPELNGSYARKAQELSADYVFVIDKPVISEEFVAEIDRLGLPLVWLDHHDLLPEEFEKKYANLFIYNPARNTGKEKSEEPTTYLTYRITERKESIWLAMMGCIADHHLPEFSEEFSNQYPEYWSKKIEDPFEAYYTTEIGKLAMALNLGLKDSITHVVQLQNFLISARHPSDILSETPQNFSFRKRYREVKRKYDSLILLAQQTLSGKLLFFSYSGELSMSADVANELSFRNQGIYIVVAYKKGAVTNMSIRGAQARNLLERTLQKIKGSGGGHEDAVGARIETQDLHKFQEVFQKEIEKRTEQLA